MPANSTNQHSPSVQFWILAAFIGIVFLTGGASRVDVQSLAVVLPLSAAIAALSLITLKLGHFAGRKWLLIGFASVACLCLAHVIPLLPGLWQSLPGRGILAEVDRVAGLGDVWRPLTMTPMDGWHALASLSTPLAVLLLGVQLDRDDLYRLLTVLLIMGGLSGLLGMLQIIGDPHGPLYFYGITNNGSAVGLFANRNHAAILLACIFPMLAVFASISTGTVDQQRIRQFAAMAAGIVLVPLILVTGSRSGILMLLPALAASALLYRKPVEGRTVRRGEVRFKLAAGHVVAAAVILSLVFLTIVYARAEAWDRLFNASAGEESRAEFWEIGIQMIWAYFPFGSGMGSFVDVYQLHEPSNYLQPTYNNHMHNDWLEIALTGGLPAILILLVASIFYTLRTAGVWRRKDADRRAVKFARLGSVLIAIIALASVADYPLRTPTMMLVFAILCLWLTNPALETDGSASAANEDN